MPPFDEIADSRPRIRRDVLYTQTPEGVLFHNAHGGFGVTAKDAYRFASLIVPHLNGRHTVAEISQGFGEHHRTMFTELVRTLYTRGFARDAGPAPEGPSPLTPEAAARFGPQIEYVDHYVGDAEERFHRFRQTRVAVLGDDELARWSVLSLLRNGCATVGVLPGLTELAGYAEIETETAALTKAGCPAEVATLTPAAADHGRAELDGYDVVLVTGPEGPRRIARLLEAGLPDGRLLLPAWTIGANAVIGPLMSADRTGCWLCAALRLGTGARAGDAADLWSDLAPLAPLSTGSRQPHGPLAAMLGNLLGYEVFRITTGALPAETDGRLLVQDLDSLDVVGEPLHPHPRCARCTADDRPDLAGLDLAGLDLAGAGREEDFSTEDGASEAALAELDDRAVLVGPHAGVFARYADDDWRQTPLKAGTVTLNLAPGVQRTVSAGDVHHVAGARLRALYRAAEVYAEHAVPPRTATAADAELARVRPELLGTASGLPAGTVRDWSPATSLLTGERALVPVAALRTFGPHNRDRAFEATSAGTGAGGTLAEAAARGLRTALGYDALRRTLRGRLAARELPLEILAQDAQLTFLGRSAQNHALEPELLRLGDADEPLPVVLARAADPAAGGYRWALGSGLSLRDAVLEAVRDLLTAVQLDRDPAAATQGGTDTGDPLIGELDPSTLTPAGTAGATLGENLEWPQVLERLRASGRDVLLAPCGPADLRAGRIDVVKVLLTDGTSDA
ncbi:TOMM precursor leader peptide-binding protein [Kitasatospora sp. NPDC092948]|uniref:TOMM precursor leader peptide-binding protein n=1 Tax=Kitasatospora sp. NPDC092948 TaxID=3364088 RepID=UPI0038094330